MNSFPVPGQVHQLLGTQSLSRTQFIFHFRDLFLWILHLMAFEYICGTHSSVTSYSSGLVNKWVASKPYPFGLWTAFKPMLLCKLKRRINHPGYHECLRARQNFRLCHIQLCYHQYFHDHPPVHSHFQSDLMQYLTIAGPWSAVSFSFIHTNFLKVFK